MNNTQKKASTKIAVRFSLKELKAIRLREIEINKQSVNKAKLVKHA